MPTSSNVDFSQANGTPKFMGSHITTPRTYKGSKSSKLINLSKQAFKVGHQTVNLDVDLMSNRLEGKTEMIIVPSTSSLKVVKLDCRDMKINNIFVNNMRTVNYIYQNMLNINDESMFEESITKGKVNIFDLYSDEFSIHQHHIIRQKLNYILGEANYDPRDPPKEIDNGSTEELTIILPDNLRIELTDVSHSYATGSQPGILTPSHLKSRGTASETYTPFNVKIEYEVINPKNGINFITSETEDIKNWHVNTTNSIYNVSTSSWVPCVDNLWDRNTWTIEISTPRTLKDVGNSRIIGSENVQDSNKGASRADDENDDNESDEEDANNHDFIVCSGDFENAKETPHPIDLSKKVVSWSIFNPVCAHHVGWAVGCFESIVISSGYTENEDDGIKDQISTDNVGKSNAYSPVIIYCLEQHLELAKNTCIIASRAMEFYSREFGSFPFSSFAMVFVDNAVCDSDNFAGLSIFSTRMLYPVDVIEPMFENTDILLESLASQWSGVNIVSQTFNDLWLVLGVAKFMAMQYIKHLMGSNEYRFRIRKGMEKVMEQDIGRKPLAMSFYRFPISQFDLSFISLKAPIVLGILDRRMTKTDKSFGLSRVIPKLFLQAMSGDLQNSTLSTQHFQYVCEKVNRNKLETFFKQWVFGSGYPIFNVSQKFNKKRSMIEMVVRQVQHRETKKLHPKASRFVDDAIALLDDEPSYQIQSVFTGPMTIRVHETDGTPYEHIVDLKEGNTRIDIQYNTKTRRMKKLREEQAEVLASFSKLGDVLSDPKDMREWSFSDWVKDENDMHFNEAFEWIRVDSDFEWIAKINVRQPDYMYGSQLQYDRDVEAHYEAVKYFGSQERPNSTHYTTLTRTLMDNRYYYGVRVAAADALANISKEENKYMGAEYLVKAFKSLFCFPDSSIPLSNNFNNFGDYFLQKEICRILSDIRDTDGNVLSICRELIYNLIRYNENTNNSFQDSFYVSSLLEALTNCTINSNVTPLSQSKNIYMGELDTKSSEKKSFIDKVTKELNSLQRIDELVPSFHNVLSVSCISQKIKLASHGLLKLTFEDLLYYTLTKFSVDVRLMGFKGLFTLGGLKNKAVMDYFLKVCLFNSQNAYFRTKLIQLLIDSLAVAAVDGLPSILDDPEFNSVERLLSDISVTGDNSRNMVIVEESSKNEINSRRDAFARATLNGTIDLLRRDYSSGKGLTGIFWQLLHTSLLGIYERRNVFNICQILFREEDSFKVVLSIPNLSPEDMKKKFVLKNLGEGKIIIKREGRYKIQLASRKFANESNKTKASATKHTEPEMTSKENNKAKSGTKLKLVVPNVNKPSSGPSKKSARTKAKGKNETSEHVTIDPINRGLVTFKLDSKKLSKFSKKHDEIRSDMVDINGSVVKIRLSRLAEALVKPSLYIKISLKDKSVYVSRSPFDSLQTLDNEYFKNDELSANTDIDTHNVESEMIGEDQDSASNPSKNLAIVSDGMEAMEVEGEELDEKDPISDEKDPISDEMEVEQAETHSKSKSPADVSNEGQKDHSEQTPDPKLIHSETYRVKDEPQADIATASSEDATPQSRASNLEEPKPKTGLKLKLNLKK